MDAIVVDDAAQALRRGAGAGRRLVPRPRRRGLRPARARTARASRRRCASSSTLTMPDEGTASVAGHDVRARAERRAARDRLRAAGLRRRPVRHGPREPDAAGPRPGHERPRPARRARRAARARRDRGCRRPHRQDLLGRHAPPARHRARARAPPARALSRRADDGARPGGARRDVVRGVAARRGGVADDPADDALPRGGRPARRPARDRLAGKGRRRGHADAS